MSYTLILLLIANGATAQPISAEQLGPYNTVQECEQIKTKAIDKMHKDLGVEIKGSCVQEEPTERAVKLYEDGKDIN